MSFRMVRAGYVSVVFTCFRTIKVCVIKRRYTQTQPCLFSHLKAWGQLPLQANRDQFNDMAAADVLVVKFSVY